MIVSNTNKKQVAAIADKYGVGICLLDSGWCLTGFYTFEQAEAVAEETGGKVTSLRCRDGGRYESRGEEYAGLDLEAYMLEDYEHLGIRTYHSVEDYLESEKDSIKQRIDDVDNFDDFDYLVDQIHEAQKVAKEAKDMSDDEFMAVYEGCEEVVYRRSGTFYHHDVWTYEIAVEWDDIRELEELAEYINGCAEYTEDIEYICDRNGWDLGEGDVIAIDEGCMEQLVRQDGELKVVELPDEDD